MWKIRSNLSHRREESVPWEIRFNRPLPCSCSTFILIFYIIIEAAHDKTIKTYNKTWVTNKDSDQPVFEFSMARVLVYLSLDSTEAVEGTCISNDSDQTARMSMMIWVFAGRTSLRMSRLIWIFACRTSYCRLDRALAHLSIIGQFIILRLIIKKLSKLILCSLFKWNGDISTVLKRKCTHAFHRLANSNQSK